MSVYSLLNSGDSASKNGNRNGRISINSLLSRPGDDTNKTGQNISSDRATASLDHRSSMVNRHTSMYISRNNSSTRTALPPFSSLRQSFHENDQGTRNGNSRQDRMSGRPTSSQGLSSTRQPRTQFASKHYDGPDVHKVGRTISVPHNNFVASTGFNSPVMSGSPSSQASPGTATANNIPSNQDLSKQLANPPRRRWKEWEDDKLIRLVNDMGPHHWNSIAEHFPGRNGRQVRLRWMNHLQPSLDKRPWRDDEDNVLLAAHAELGNKWALIAMRLNGRTDNSVKNRYKSITRKTTRTTTTTIGTPR